MLVCGTLKIGEEVCSILFSGSEDQCFSYACSLDPDLYYDIHICEDNGVIKWRLK